MELIDGSMDLWIAGWMDSGMGRAHRIHESVIHQINLAYENEERIDEMVKIILFEISVSCNLQILSVVVNGYLFVHNQGVSILEFIER